MNRNSNKYPECGTRLNLKRRMTDEFLELIHGIPCLQRLAHVAKSSEHFIEYLGLFTGFPADAPRVIENDEREKECHREFKSRKTVPGRNRYNHGADGGAVRTRHTAASRDPGKVEILSLDQDFNDNL